MKDYEILVDELIANEVCEHCALRVENLMCRKECPYQNFFDELAIKCEDINRDANYLLDLAADEDNQCEDDKEYDNFYEVDHMTVNEMMAHSHFDWR